MIKHARSTDKLFFVPVLLLSLLFTSSSDLLLSQTITTGTLVREMVDLKSLVEFPQPAYKTVQFSSYDRRSTAPDAPGWFSNADGFGQEPIPGFEKILKEPDENGIGEYLMCDVSGPGAIVRLWTARIEGDIRFFIDEDIDPVYEGPAQPFFLETYNSLNPEIPADQFKGTFTQNMAGYYPIPFEKRCRIEWIGDLKNLHFYHIGIRLYEKGTKVQSFRISDLKTYHEAIQKTLLILKDPGAEWVFSPELRKTHITAGIQNGEKKELFKLKGPGTIECITLRLSAGNPERVLRQNILHISFDGSDWGQVQCPVGDFFGAAPGINPYQSIPFTVNADGTMTCRFVMPYRDSVSLSVENTGDGQTFISGYVLSGRYNWKEKRSMYFRARWRVDHNLVSSNEEPYDIPYLVTQGKGVIVGAAAMIMNPTSVPSSWGNWWGEGDEKIFVDDDAFPSFFGTGSEDYFNYAWSSSELFAHGYCGQPRNDGPANRGFVTNYRWHILDPIPFENRTAFYMELLSHGPVPGFSYGRIVYHYGFPGMNDDHIPLTTGDVALPQLPENWMPARRYFCANADFFQAEEIVRENQEFALKEKDIWAGGKLLVWEGDQIAFSIPVKEEGEYVIVLTACRMPGAGSFESEIDGQKLTFGNNTLVDLSVPHGILSRNYVAAPVKLEKGEHELVLTNRSEPDKPIGIDFIWVMKR